MPKQPAIQFYIGDWMKDPAVRSVSYAARGLWMDMLCLMYESPCRGYLQHGNEKPVQNDQLGRMTGGQVETVEKLVQELEDSQVFSRTKDGIIYSRRMVRDEIERKRYTQFGKKGGNPQLIRGVNPNLNPRHPLKPTPSSSSSSSSSSSKTTDNSPPINTPLSADAADVLDYINKTEPFGQDGPYQLFIERLITIYPAPRIRRALDDITAYCAKRPEWEKSRRDWRRVIVNWLKRDQETEENRGKVLGSIAIKPVPVKPIIR